MKLYLLTILLVPTHSSIGSVKELLEKDIEKLESQVELELASYAFAERYFRGPVEYHISDPDAADILLPIAHRSANAQDQVLNGWIEYGRHVVYHFEDFQSMSRLSTINAHHNKSKIYIMILRDANQLGNLHTAMFVNNVKDVVAVTRKRGDVSVFRFQGAKRKDYCLNIRNAQEVGVWRDGQWLIIRSLFGYEAHMTDCYGEIYMFESKGLGSLNNNVIKTFQGRIPFSYMDVIPEKTRAIHLGHEVRINLMGNKEEGTTAYATTRLVAVVPRAGLYSIWRRIFDALDPVVWVAIMVTLIVKFLYAGIMNSMPLLTVWALFLGSSTTEAKINYSSFIRRVNIVLWMFTSLVITQSYLGSFTGNLTVPSQMPDIDTLQELAEAELPVICTRRAKEIFSDDEAGQKILENCDESMTANVSVDQVALKTMVFFTLMGPDREDPTHGRDDVKILPIMSYQTSFMVAAWASVRDEMNRILLHLAQGGFLSLWEKDQIEGLRTIRNEIGPVAINFGHVAGIFVGLFVGLLISALVFIAEFYF